jgi:DNA polymerase-1
MMNPLTPKAYGLFHEGIIALAQVEANGIHIDVQYCKDQIIYIGKKITRLLKQLDKTEEFVLWKKVYGSKFSIDSNPQLSDVLFNRMNHKAKIFTKGSTDENPTPSVSQEAITALKLPFTEKLIQYRKYSKAINTYLKNFVKEAGTTGILHPFFNLHTVVTFRSSSSNPNWQNIPARDKEIKRLVRKAVKARPGHHIVEIDYSGIEVSIAACYHQDPTMLKYLRDPKSNMHRDMAMICFKLDMDQWTDLIRYSAKNKFVFPEFYGDYFVTCATNLWADIDTLKLETAQGVPLREHLRKKGIKTYKQFENHIKKVEKDFWRERFPVYAKWKDTHHANYEERGYFDLKTGFRCHGIMARNEVINYPVQGAAFHCLLWSLIQVNKKLNEKGFESCIIGQIHDSLLLDIKHEELEEVLEICKQVTCADLEAHWDWITVPMGVDVEVAPLDKSWYDKAEITNKVCPHCQYPIMWKREKGGEDYYQCVECEKSDHKLKQEEEV